MSRHAAEARGRRGETIAAWWLRLHGWRIVASRVRTPVGEVDLVARRGRTVAFVEVKARRDVDSAVFAVTGTAQHRIRAASDIWLSRQPDAHRLSLRYDIVAVLPWRIPKHLPDAF